MVKKNHTPKKHKQILHWDLFYFDSHFLHSYFLCMPIFLSAWFLVLLNHFILQWWFFLKNFTKQILHFCVNLFFDQKWKLDFYISVYLNGGHDLPSLTSSGPGSITEELPPDLPLLPPMMPLMQTAPPPMMYPADNRPAPLGRRSPPHGGRGGRYSRSPSPTYGENR